MISPMQLKNFEIWKLDFTLLPRRKNSKQKIDINLIIQVNKKNKNLIRLTLIADIADIMDIFSIKIKFRAAGYFLFDEDLDRKEIDKYLFSSGITIVYSMMRSHILNITSASPIKGYLLPTLKTADIMKKYFSRIREEFKKKELNEK